MAGKDLSIFMFIYICNAIITVNSQNLTMLENPQILSRQGQQGQQRRVNEDQRITSIDQRITSLDQRITSPDQRITFLDNRVNSIDPRGNNLRGFTSLQQRGTETQSIGSNQHIGNNVPMNISPQRRGNDAQRGTSPRRRGNLVQLVTSPQRTGNPMQHRTSPQLRGTSPQLRGGENSRRSLVQSQRIRPQRRPLLNLQNLQRTPGVIPRARNFQDSLRNLPRRDPRTGMISRGIRPRMISGPQSQRSSANNNPLCASPRSIKCYSWPRNQDSRRAYICDGRCQGRSCPVPCECSCVDPRLIDRLIAIGRIRGPELIPLDQRLRDGTRRQRLRNRILALQAERRRRPSAQIGTNSNRDGQTNQDSQRRPLFDLNFGISDDVLATLIAQPVLNEIVGPQGINQIIAGEPPPLLMREDRIPRTRSTSLTNGIRQPDIRAVETSLPRAQPTVEIRGRERGMGIPVPLSRLNFAPGTESNPAMGNMRVIMSDIRPFEDPTAGLNIAIPNPTPVDVPAENQVSVRQLPGSNVLFVDLTNPSPTDQMRGFRTFNGTSPRNIALLQSSNQTLPGSLGNGGNLRTFQDGSVSGLNPLSGGPPTQDQCLAQRTELWCDPKKPWDGTPGLFRWCLLNCRADNCDNQRCACACIDELLFKTKYEQLSLRAP